MGEDMTMQHLTGLIAAPFTPMHSDGVINLTAIEPYYKMLKANGLVGAFICGSTGEGVSLTMEEKKAVATAWGDATRGDEQFKVMMFVGGTCLSDCVDLARHARAVGLYAISFTAPFYFKPANVAVLGACCKIVADAAPDMPFYYYHIPVLTGVNFPAAELLKYADETISNFAGVKYTHEDFTDYLTCLNYKDKKYDMLWGRDETMLSALALGAKGAVGSTFNYIMPLYQNLIEAFTNGDYTRARALQQQSVDLISLLGKYGGIATGKGYMRLLGLDCGLFRLPVQNMTTEAYTHFEKEADAFGFHTIKSVVPAS